MNNSRALFVIFTMLVFFFAVAARLFHVQLTMHEDLKYVAENQQIEDKKIRAERGSILDRNGELLAYDRNDVTFHLDMAMFNHLLKDISERENALKKKNKSKKEIRHISPVDSLASKFHLVFGKPVGFYKNLIKTAPKKGKLVLEEKATAEKAILLKNLRMAGLTAVNDPTRIYAYDNLASHVLGYLNDKYEGSEGIEKFYNKMLVGADGHMLVQRDVNGEMISVAEDATLSPSPGKNVVLTIDKSYQKIVEEELRTGAQQNNCNAAVGIVMDPNTGEILALANYPDFNPNVFWKVPDEARKNRAVTDPIEPGSTFKPISLSTLLDQKLCGLNETVFAENGRYKYKNVPITDSHRHGILNVREVIEQSSNIGMAKLTEKINEDVFYKYLRNYGFGNYSFIDLPSESKGKLIKPENWGSVTQAFMSFGYQLMVTPVQLTAAYSALINGGVLYQPHLLKKIVSKNNEIVEETTPKVLRSVISEKTSAKLRDIMVGVIENGTGKLAKIENINVGGKTGTSQILVNGRYSSAYHHSSFMGFFPAENPKLIVYILMDAPGGQTGGVVAAPVFKRITERLINTDMNLFSKTQKKGTLQNKEQKNTKTNDSFKQVFTANEKHDGSTNYANYSQAKDIKQVERKMKVTMGLMPDLTQSNIRDAISALKALGVSFSFEGDGKVVWQSIQPGESITKGAVCKLKCEEKKISGVRIN